jgi:hypothetical protein
MPVGVGHSSPLTNPLTNPLMCYMPVGTVGVGDLVPELGSKRRTLLFVDCSEGFIADCTFAFSGSFVAAGFP